MIIEKLEEQLKIVLDRLNYDSKDLKVIKSNRPDLCDYQYDGCFQLAKQYHRSPIEIGEQIQIEIMKLKNIDFIIEKVEFVRPGFINITISDQYIQQILEKMNSEVKFGLKEPKLINTYILDYGGPNIAKPLHVGHMRTAIVGESIKRIIDYMGHKTIADVHLGDYGLQIGQVIYGVLGDEKPIGEIDLEYLEKIYPKISALCKEDEKVKEVCSEITRKLQDGNKEYQKIWKRICEISGTDIKRLYQYLGISFDLWLGESDAYSYIPQVEEQLNLNCLLEDSEGARIVNVAKESDKKEVPPLIFQKSNGAYLYGTTDLGTIYQREQDYHPDYILYIVDNRQELHFEQVFRVARKANITAANLEFLGYGTVNGTDGKPYKTRKGDAPKLDSLFAQVKKIFISKKDTNKELSDEDLDKIVNSILKFADLQNNRDKDYIFDISKFSEVVGKTGPYVLYTYLRVQKILKDNLYETVFDSHIYNESDRNLRIKLLDFDIALENAFQHRMPSYIAEYIYELCVLINSFYQNNYIYNLEDKIKKNTWLSLLELSNKVLKEMLKLLIIDVPTSM